MLEPGRRELCQAEQELRKARATVSSSTTSRCWAPSTPWSSRCRKRPWTSTPGTSPISRRRLLVPVKPQHAMTLSEDTPLQVPRRAAVGKGRTLSSHCRELDRRLWESRETYSPTADTWHLGPLRRGHLRSAVPTYTYRKDFVLRSSPSTCYTGAPQQKPLCQSAPLPERDYIVHRAGGRAGASAEPEILQRSACLGRRRSSFTGTRLKRMSVVPPGNRPVARTKKGSVSSSHGALFKVAGRQACSSSLTTSPSSSRQLAGGQVPAQPPPQPCPIGPPCGELKGGSARDLFQG